MSRSEAQEIVKEDLGRRKTITSENLHLHKGMRTGNGNYMGRVYISNIEYIKHQLFILK